MSENNVNVRIMAVGDIMIHSRYNEMADSKGTGFLFEHTAATLGEADLLFGNVETVLSSIGEPAKGKLCLRGDARYVPELGRIGFDLVSVANNHAFDFGIEAYSDMVRRLEAEGIAVVGGGLSLPQSRQPGFAEVSGIRFGFLAYSSHYTDGSDYAEEGKAGVTPLVEELIFEDIASYRDQVDHLVVSLHWGVEYSEYPTPDQVKLGRKLIDAGVRIIIGHHPHILQGYEAYGGGYIFYSLGNFCDSDLFWQGDEKVYQSTLKIADRESAIAALDISRTGIEKVEMLPLWLNDEGQAELCAGESKICILEKLVRRSEVLARPGFDEFWEKMILDKRIGNAVRIWLNNGSIFDKIRNFKLSWFKTLWEMGSMYLQATFSRSTDKYNLINPGKDKKPRPYCGED
jgi:poly-gamma-glutamate capsule biosynthesis protein CapA/YwtB (metallophosphatase superfamily)